MKNRTYTTKEEEAFLSARPFLKSWAFRVMSSGADEESTIHELTCMGLLPGAGMYVAIAVDFEIAEHAQYDIFAAVERLLLKKDVSNMAFFEPGTFMYICSTHDNNYSRVVADMITVAELINEQVAGSYMGDYSIGVGQEVRTISEVPLSGKTAEEACKYRYRLGGRQVIYINDVEPKKKKGEYRFVHQDEFTTSIKVGSEEMMVKNVERIFDEMVQQGEGVNYAKRVCLELIVCTVRAIYEIGQNPNMLFDKTDLWTVINRCESMEQLKDLIVNTNKVVISQLFHKQVSKNRALIEKAKRIINEDTDGKVSLESVAEQAFISPCYLSLIFRREMSMTFKEYLMQSRITKAKKLLLDHKNKIYQVARAVGYTDSRYFSDLFRKYEGITPTEYRKKYANNEL